MISIHTMALLLVLVVSNGSPAKRHVATDTSVKVFVSFQHPGSIPPLPPEVASGRHGRLAVHLKPGTYRVAAVLSGNVCNARTIRLRPGREKRVVLSCPAR
jgi:hypothetical protein